MAQATQTKQTQATVLKLAETGILLALSIVLFEFIPVFSLPYGGSVTLCAQLPIVILGYRHGVKWGFFAGFALSLIQLMFGLGNFAWVTGITAYIILTFADYIIAFTALGLGGMFKKVIKNQALSITAGAIVVSSIRFLCHIVSGATIWGSYMPEDMYANVWTYSFFYNATYMIPEIILTAIGAFIIGSIFELRGQNVTMLKRK